MERMPTKLMGRGNMEKSQVDCSQNEERSERSTDHRRGSSREDFLSDNNS